MMDAVPNHLVGPSRSKGRAHCEGMVVVEGRDEADENGVSIFLTEGDVRNAARPVVDARLVIEIV